MDVALWIVVSVGAVITLAGLVLFILVFMAEQRRKAGLRAGEGDWFGKLLEKILELIREWTPKVYRVPVVLMLLGALIMFTGLGIGLAGDDDDGGGGTTTAETTTG